MNRVYRATGGRKMLAQYLANALLTAMALVTRADFREYALAVGGVLAITLGGIAYEDSRRGRAADDGEPTGGYRRPEGWRPEPLAEVDEP